MKRNEKQKTLAFWDMICALIVDPYYCSRSSHIKTGKGADSKYMNNIAISPVFHCCIGVFTECTCISLLGQVVVTLSNMFEIKTAEKKL